MPTNADIQSDDFQYLPITNGEPFDYYEPSMESNSGANYFDRNRNMLYLVVRGREPLEIRTAPVIQVNNGLGGVRSDELYSRNNR